jgi:ribose 5-phosphate isomerase B
VVAIGARQHTIDEATAIVEAFLTSVFSGSDRHARRIAQVGEYERTHTLPALP